MYVLKCKCIKDVKLHDYYFTDCICVSDPPQQCKAGQDLFIKSYYYEHIVNNLKDSVKVPMYEKVKYYCRMSANKTWAVMCNVGKSPSFTNVILLSNFILSVIIWLKI